MESWKFSKMKHQNTCIQQEVPHLGDLISPPEIPLEGYSGVPQ